MGTSLSKTDDSEVIKTSGHNSLYDGSPIPDNARSSNKEDLKISGFPDHHVSAENYSKFPNVVERKRRKTKKVNHSSEFVQTLKPAIQYISLRETKDSSMSTDRAKVKLVRTKKGLTKHKKHSKPSNTNRKPETLQETNTILLDIEDQRQCPICLEKYKDPRLLPCFHTFCFPCLVDHTGIRSNRKVENLVCPICRAKIPIQDGGIKSFPTNFFVVAEDGRKCDMCREKKGEDVCTGCQKLICGLCLSRHKCLKNERERGILDIFELVGRSPNDSDSDSSTRSDISIPFLFTRPVGLWSTILLKEETQFKIEEDYICAHIVQKSSEELWMLTGSSENISIGRFKTDGTRLQTLEISYSINFAVEQSNLLLVPFLEEATVCRLKTDTEHCPILSQSIFHPVALDIFPNGTILVVGYDMSNVDDVALGCVKILLPDGDEISTFTTGYSVVPSKACILNEELICLGFTDNHFVDIRLRDGNVVGKYKGNNLDDDDVDDDSFEPFSICVSTYGREPVVLVSDSYTDTIHMISYAADFIGLLMKFPTPYSSGLGEPGAITVGPSGQIWIAQKESNEVSCYSICKYHNITN